MEEQGFTLSEIAKQRGLSKSTIRAYFLLKKSQMVEGRDWFTVLTPVKTNKLALSGIHILFPKDAPAAPVTSHRYQFRLSVC